MTWVQIKAETTGQEARFGLVEDYPDSYELHEGLPLADSFPDDAHFAMDKDYRKQTQLTDVLHTLGDVLVVSERLRGILEARKTAGLEFLPVGLRDHAGKKVKAEYFVANLLPLVDCVDRKKTKYKPNKLDPDELTSVSNLTLDEKKIPTDVELFRTKGIPVLMVARRRLIDDLLKAKISGLGTAELAAFTW
jgi:hypothetical protein